MHGIAKSMVLATCLSVAACGGGDEGDTSGTSSTSTSTTTKETGGTGGAMSPGGLPEGVSSWMGEGEVDGQIFPIEATITNNGGDLTGTATLKGDLIGTGVLALSGTHEPTAGRVALAPNDWIMEPGPEIEVIGLDGTYDIEEQTLTGLLVDFAKGNENYLLGGPFALHLADKPGEATIRGEESKSLVAGSQKFKGQVQCSGPVREVAGELIYDGAGRLTGTLTVGDTGLATPIGTFAITGVHNPSTGGITLVPGLWIDDQGTLLTFYIDGTYDPMTGSFNGDQWINLGACPAGKGTWQTVIE